MSPAGRKQRPLLCALALAVSAAPVPAAFAREDRVPGLGPVSARAVDCAVDPRDPFESRKRLERGVEAGACFDAREKRGVRVLGRFETGAGRVVRIANLYHRGRFWVADVPVEAVEGATMLVEHFPAPVPAAHTMIRVDFDPARPVRMATQSGSVEPVETASIKGIALSVEAGGGENFKYDLVRGMRQDFVAVHRVTSLEEKVRWTGEVQGHRVEQLPMRLDRGESAGLLERYFDKSEAADANFVYHTLNANCTTELFAVLDDVRPGNALDRFVRWAERPVTAYPVLVWRALQARGYLGKGKLPDLADDPTVR
jgi:hypothetical protein